MSTSSKIYSLMERVSTLEKSGVSSTSVSVDNSKVELLEKKL